jgi:hypothetical protein
MNVQNLKIGDIIIKKIENGDAKVIVVGSTPIESDTCFTFKAVLKENNRDVFKVSLSNTTINKEDGAACVISTFDDAITFNIRNVFTRKSSDFYNNMNTKICLALRKRNWVYDSVVSTPVFTPVGDPVADTETEPEPEPVVTTRSSTFTVTLTHDISESIDDVIDNLRDVIDDEYDNVTVEESIHPEL